MRGKMKKVILVLSIIVLTMALIPDAGKYLYAEEGASPVKQEETLIVIEASGEALLGDDTTKAQAQAASLNNARIRALEEAVGVQVRGSTLLYNSSLISDLVVTATRGLIVKQEIIEHVPRVKHDQISYYCRIKAYVKPIHAEKKGNFKILTTDVIRADSVKMKSPVFQHNDEILIRVRVNKDSYIHIFSVSQYGIVSKIYPNKYFKSEILSAGKTMVFPDDIQRRLGLKVRVTAPKKLSMAVESVLVIATREETDFLTDESIEAPVITDLMRELSEIDPSLWAEKTAGYEVRK